MANIVFDPATYYDVTVRCNTQQMANPADPDNKQQPCPNYQTEWQVPEVYSNAGQPNIQCGPCQQRVEILAATKMDPQPEVS